MPFDVEKIDDERSKKTRIENKNKNYYFLKIINIFWKFEFKTIL